MRELGPRDVTLVRDLIDGLGECDRAVDPGSIDGRVYVGVPLLEDSELVE